jgi:hypothetical protein
MSMMGASKRISNLVIFGISAAVAAIVAVLAFQPDLDAGSIALGTGAVGPTAMSAACQQADRTAVDQVAALLERNGPADAPVLERAVHTLNLARRHCLYEWDGRGLDDYQWLGRWLSEHS